MISALKVLSIAILVTVISCGCRPPAAEHSGQEHDRDGAPNLVVDIEAVAKAMGWDTIIVTQVELATRDLNAQLLKAAESMQKELKTQQAALGANPTKEQLAAFQRAQVRVQQNIENNKLIAQQARDSVRNKQVLNFRQKIKPVAARIGQERGAKVVSVANEDVIWFDGSADITGDVIAALRSDAAEQAAVETSDAGKADGSKAESVTNNPPAQ